MRMISLIRKIDNDENPDMHVIVGFVDSGEYYTRWYENISYLLSEPNYFLKYRVKCFWFNSKCNTLCIEVRSDYGI